MSEESNKYCTLIDKFGEIADDNKDYKKVFMLLSKLCMLSLLTKRVTFLLPVGKALTALSKMSAEKQREQMKRHIIGGAFTKDELMERERVYTRMTTSDGDDYKRIAYVVNKEAGTIGGIKIGKEIIVVGGSTKDSKHIPVGVAFEVEELLSEPGEEVPMRTKGPVRKGRKDKVMEGGWFGSPLEYVADQSLADYVDLGASDLRWAIVDQYRKAWPVTVFGIDSEYSWYQWMWASLLAFLKEQIPNFYWVYSPYLGMDPFASLDLLFEHYVQENYNNYILPDELLHQWTQSRWFLYNDPTILRESFTYLAGGGQRQSGGGWQFDSFISLNLDSANRYIAVGKQAIGEYMRYNNPEKLREGIVKVYKKVYEEPNFLLGETRAIYKKVDEEPFVVGLHNDLRRFLNSRFRYHSEFDQLYPSFLKCDSCGKSKGLFGYLFGVGGGGKSKSVPRAVLKSVLQYDTTTMEIDLGGSEQFRFPMEFLQDFVMSPFFMYMSITDKPDLSKMAKDSIEQQKKNEEDIKKNVIEQLHSQTGPTFSLTQSLQLPEEPERLTQHFGFRADDAPFAHSLASL
jgi:hypothetical protein